MCLGLHHLHSLGIVHRDLKPGNLLLSSIAPPSSSRQPTQTFQPKYKILISDFGQCDFVEREDRAPRTGDTGTHGFAAPELLRGGEDWDHKCDVWSLGHILYVLAFSKYPYTQISDAAELYKRIVEGMVLEFPKRHKRSLEITAMVRTLSTRDPQQRPTVRQTISSIMGIIDALRRRGSNYEYSRKTIEAAITKPPIKQAQSLPRGLRRRSVQATRPATPDSDTRNEFSNALTRPTPISSAISTDRDFQRERTLVRLLVIIAEVHVGLSSCSSAPSPIYLYPLLVFQYTSTWCEATSYPLWRPGLIRFCWSLCLYYLDLSCVPTEFESEDLSTTYPILSHFGMSLVTMLFVGWELSFRSGLVLNLSG